MVVRITKYDGIGLVAIGFAGLLLWATANAWSVLPQNAKMLGVVATLAAVGAGISMFTLDRGLRLSRVGYAIFMIGLAAFLYVMYSEVLIPDMMRRLK